MRNLNYLALDLEYNTDGKNGTEDIIQVGIAIGSPIYGVFYKQSFYPKYENKDITLYPFITNLTGITQEQYENNFVSWEEIVHQIKIMHEVYTPFVNPVTWGIGDSYDLIQTVKEQGIDFPFFGRRIIDVKHLFIFIEAANGRAMSGGLRSSMGKYKLKFQGNPHNAMDDAANTLEFYFCLLKRQKLLEDTIKELKNLKY